MPIVSIFYGITVSMYFGDHPPPHIHVDYHSHEALVRIDNSRVSTMTLIKVRTVKPLGGHRLWFEFSDGSQGERDFGDLVRKDRPVLEPLRDPAYFARVFLQRGAPTWPNGSISRPGRSMTTWNATRRSPARLMPPDPL